MSLTLYYTPRSRSFCALWLLEELGLEYKLESFDISAGRHKQADYLLLNPMGKVPLVMDGDIPVSELAAIAIYLSDRYSKERLSPAIRSSERPAYLKWILFSSALMEPAYAEKMFNWEIPARRSIAWSSFDQMLEILTNHIAQNTWVLGDKFSSADVLIGSNLHVGQVVLGIIPKEGPIAEYLLRLTKRDGFIRAMDIEKRESDRFPMKA
ncbi:glutathione S-transferase family protein [Candidatus Uabimicrobium amorphum]|uniref:Glutathione S-transferase n=1 Tax=Uabimicrobium amorphum TaxID=2596890 RepID=A0A5S9IKU2_UABAM|nr:glutathione S-transferase family protein [Candidatus Uabimicrobium amorphum]BBM83367.1 glutathione S-transferase [Candidatus Uabimicrobium amorphum]